MAPRTSESHPIRVDFVPDDRLPAGRIGLTFAPGKHGPSAYGGRWERDLEADLERLRERWGVEVLVGFLEDQEMAELEIADLGERAAACGIDYRRHPVRDGHVSADPAGYGALIAGVLADLRAGRTVVFHCRGGQGRAGTGAACALVALGVEPDEAIAVVRGAREGAIENAHQERFVRERRWWAGG